MKYIFYSLLGLLVYFSAYSQAPKPDDYIFLLRIPATKNHGGLIQTAFRLKGTKGLITTLHGVADGEIFSAVNESYLKFISLRVISVDISNDIALLGSDELNKMPADGLETGIMKSSERYYVKGHPLGINLYSKPVTIDASEYKSLAKLIPGESVKAFENRRSPELTSKIIDINSGNLVSGNSGSPLLDSHNKIIGIVDGGLLKGSVGISWAIPIDRRDWIEKRKVASRLNEIVSLKTDNLFSFETIRDQIENDFKVVSKYRQMDYSNLRDGLDDAIDGDTLYIEEGDYSGEHRLPSRSGGKSSLSNQVKPVGHPNKTAFLNINIEKNITLVGVGDSSKILLPWINLDPNYKLSVVNLTFAWPFNAAGFFLVNRCLFRSNSLNVSGNTEIYNSTFSPINSQKSNGIKTLNGRLIVENCEFRNFEIAIENGFASSAYIKNSRFYNCNTAFWLSRNSETTIKYCEFIKTKDAIKKDRKTLLSSFTGILVEEGNRGL